MLGALICATAIAGELAGVTVPDAAVVGGAPLVLNGMGLREKYTLDIYVGSLYLPARTTQESAAIQSDVPKRIVMSFLFRSVSVEQVTETFREGLANNPHAGELGEQLERLTGMMEGLRAGDTVVIDYVPGQGTSITIRGRHKGTIAGVEFMRAIWTMFLGPRPPTAAVKQGMLGL